MKKKPDELSSEIKESRDQAQEAQKVHHIEGEFRAVAALHNKIDSAFADEIENEEWKELKRTLKMNFPDVLHAKYQDLSPRQKLWAVAEVEGWSKLKFSEISGTSRTTLLKWSKQADILLFQRDYKQAQGIGDPYQTYSQQAHKALRFYDEILDWQPYDLEGKQFKFKVASYVTDKVHKDMMRDASKDVDLKSLAELLRKNEKPLEQNLDEIFDDEEEV